MLSIGLMSGTSMDGIDAALIETDGEMQVKEIAHVSLAYDPNFKILLKAQEFAVHFCKGDLNQAKKNYPTFIKEYLKKQLNMQELNINEKIKELSTYLHGANKTDALITFDEVTAHSTQLHINVVNQLIEESARTANEIDVIGYHGQTLFHDPAKKITIQVGDGQMLADQTGITVVNNFRTNDVINGGQGAPFAPIYHQALTVRDKLNPAAVVNCGGIANITIIPDSNPKNIMGFDTGPGNGPLDNLIKQRTQGKELMDKDGKYGNAGKINEKVLQELHKHALIKNGKNYFSLPPPKSLDINDFKSIKSLDTLPIEDACATLAAFTADTIVKSLQHCKIKPQTWILVGGGWNNPVILRELKQRLSAEIKNVKVLTATEVKWNNQAIEAQIFAFLAVRSLQGKPLSYPNTTGISEPLSGGHAYIPQYHKPTTAVKELLEKNPTVLNGYQKKTPHFEKTF